MFANKSSSHIDRPGTNIFLMSHSQPDERSPSPTTMTRQYHYLATKRFAVFTLGVLTLIGAMGGPCDITVLPAGVIAFVTVTIELVNTTAYPIEPNLYVDPEDDIWFLTQLITDENFVFFDVPILPGEIVQIAFDCSDIGSVISDHAFMFITENEYIQSDNGPFLVGDEDFGCGDIISFIFIDEGPDGDFFTRVEINGEFLED